MQFQITEKTDLQKVSVEMGVQVTVEILKAMELLKEKNKDKKHFEITLDVILNLRDTKLEDQ